ncbi:nucleoside triphosphate pyrophosphohydrolase [Longirhabdus pacifica]|uniref:nucleoside triphosphate pyrophosphohydrolase n=1 Tax=Longirhabdus pacifica TaxID=2305227 RepID=UPI001008BA09|nr:nucleoside triphosphate pyrophosphohydrolase [Longirhabdus pacifica]
MRLTIVGLGSGNPEQITLEAWHMLTQTEHVYLRTGTHPIAKKLKEQGITYHTFDDIYEKHDSFSNVYQNIHDVIISEIQQKNKEIVYAVPGHPMIAEETVKRLKLTCEQEHISLRILGGESFLDQLFIAFNFDPIEGFQLLDATAIEGVHIDAKQHLIICQIYNQFTASDVKLTLMEQFPEDYEVTVGHALGIEGEESLVNIPLYALDRIDGYGNTSVVWVPRSEDTSLANRSFEQLHRIVNILRSPEGCPWDRKQTHQSIRKNLIEETFEVIEAIDEDDVDGMQEELGDLLLQVMMHAQMEEEEGVFNVWDVIEGINEKLIRRHPHVFGHDEALDAEEALQNWEQVKKTEKEMKGKDIATSILDSVPSGMPAYFKAMAYQKKAAKVGFDWSHIDDVIAKLQEEIVELKEAILQQNKEEQRLEFGDVLFSVLNIARCLDIDPDEALSAINQKFYYRFHYIEDKLKMNHKTFQDTSLEEMETWWQEAKDQTKK